MSDTIFALATGAVKCAVAIVRVSGPSAETIGRRFCGAGLRPRVAAYRKIVDPSNGDLIDHGLVLFFAGPGSFSGEDCLEFQVHGGRAVIARLLAALSNEPGVRMAQPGEFIRRAFDNGKFALTSIEGIADLIDARTDAQRRQALAQAGGLLAQRAEQWRDRLLDCLALIEAEIDFVDEGDAPSGVVPSIRLSVVSLFKEFEIALSDADRGERIRSGFRVVIAGPPNAGKSSLINALAKRDVAIVTEHAGTTRDVIEVELDLEGLPVIFCDTAGIRETADVVEAIGVSRSLHALRAADLVIWLMEASSKSANLPQVDLGSVPTLVVASKLDLYDGMAPGWADLGIAVRDSSRVAELVDRVRAIAEVGIVGEPPLVTNLRQKRCVAAAAGHLSRLMSVEVNEIEFMAEDLRLCARELEELVGKIDPDHILGAIFSRFCLGK